MPLPLEDIQAAVCAWHNRHPLAARIGAEAVHSVGWVALPFMKAAQAQEPTLDGTPVLPVEGGKLARRWLGRGQRGPGPWPVFSETFIEGLKPRRVAAFAALHAWNEPPDDGSEWPQRRIEVDSALAEACPGAWPTERWLVAAAVDHQGERLRVLLGERQGRLAVLSAQRHWERPRLAIAGALLAFVLAALAWLLWPQGAAPTVPAASAGSASAPAASAIAASAAAPASRPAAEPASAASDAPASGAASAPASSAAPADPAASEAIPDIRPRLGPVRRSPREVLEGRATAPAAPTAAASAASGSPSSAPSSQAPTASAPAPYRGAATPEQLRLQNAAAGPQVALVSPGFAKKAEAEAQLERMRVHVQAIVSDAALLQAEVFETPQGWRAAVWPFGTREEAQIVNATMVARGWKTRAVDF